MGKKWPTNFTIIWRVPHRMKGSLTCHKSVTWKSTIRFISPHIVQSGGVKSGDLGGHAVFTASPNPVTW
jgi:hypothetical protein